MANVLSDVKREQVVALGRLGAEAHPVIVTAPGEEAQVDYGDGAMVRDPQTGTYRRTRLFVLTLGASRKAVRLLIRRSSAAISAQLHETAFRRLGVAPRIVVLDYVARHVIAAITTSLGGGKRTVIPRIVNAPVFGFRRRPSSFRVFRKSSGWEVLRAASENRTAQGFEGFELGGKVGVI